MLKRWLALLALLVPAPAYAATYWADPAGSGSTCSEASPCTIAGIFLAKAVVAGDIIMLKDGTYTGTNGMLQPTAQVNGASGNPITVRPVTPGEVLIDGDSTRTPIRLTGNDWWVIEDINAKEGGTEGAVYISSFEISPGVFNNSDNNIIRRVVAWDGSPATSLSGAFTVSAGDNNLLEDIAAFGIGRKLILWISGGANNNLTVRRAWCRWEYSTNSSPKACLDTTYDSRHLLVENSIWTWAQRPGANTNQFYAPFARTGPLNSGTRQMDNKFFGNIVYIPQGVTFGAAYATYYSGLGLTEFRDHVVYLPPDQSTKIPLFAGLCETADSNGIPCSSPQNNLLTRVTTIGGTANTIHAHWTQTDVDAAATVALAYPGTSLYMNGDTRATICNRYVDGVLTDTPLFPWPMNQRIIDAMTDAGLTPVDVDATIQGIFGAYPASCDPASGSPSPNVRIERDEELFAGAAGALGGNFTQLNTTTTANRNGTGRVTGSAAASDGGMARETVATYSAKQYAKITFHSVGTSLGELSYVGVGCFAGAGTGAARTGYQFTVSNLAGDLVARLAEWNSGFTILESWTGIAWVDGDTIEIECDGSTIWVMRNGLVIDTVMDSTLTSGRPFVRVSGDAEGDTWSAGDINFDATVPVVGGGGTITPGTTTSVTQPLSLAAGTDDATAPEDLLYAWYRSTSNNINSVANIEANGTLMQDYTAAATTYTALGLTPSTPYFFNVILKDETGNKVAYTTATDTTEAAPVVSMTAPTDLATVSGAAVTVTASATSAVVGMASVQFFLDGSNLGALDTSSPFTLSWDSTTATNGSHTLHAIGCDTAGGCTDSATITVTVNNSPDVGLTNLAFATLFTPFDYTIVGAVEGDILDVSSGALPLGVVIQGLALDGAPTELGSFLFTIRKTDAMAAVTFTSYLMTVGYGGAGAGRLRH